MPNLDAFKGVFPYAAELLGVFQPLLGWRGKGGRRLVQQSIAARAVGLIHALATHQTRGAAGPGDTALPERFPGFSGNPVIDALAESAFATFGNVQELSAGQWQQLTETDRLGPIVQSAIESLGTPDPAGGADALRAEMTASYRATAQALTQLRSQPATLNSLVLSNAASVAEMFSAINLLERFPSFTGEAFLSPVGILHLFRQYFFELDSFLGPPVSHVWLAPGTTTEFIEVRVRRELVERTVEAGLETTSRSELTSTEKEELADAIKQENADNTKVGVSARAGWSAIVASGEASASFNLDVSRKTASETTHKQSREQSERVTSEIRRTFKTTFRTVTETTDTSSRRYVVENKTDKLLNYELRRKMRKVGVQVQHIDTQLCWQYYVDEPGRELGISALVHASRFSDVDAGLTPPEKPPEPKPIESPPFVVDVAFEPVGPSDPWFAWRSLEEDVEFQNGQGVRKVGMLAPPDYGYIRAEFERVVTPPLDYVLEAVRFEGLGPKDNVGHPEPEVMDVDAAATSPDGNFKIALKRVRFHFQRRIKLQLKAVFVAGPTLKSKLEAEHQARVNNYGEERARAYQEAFIKAVRDRIRAMGEVKTRRFEDLREEERHGLYRRLVRALVRKGSPSVDRHVTAELIRQLFDVDSMLYFVAPDWWVPGPRGAFRADVDEPIPTPPQVKKVTVRPSDTVQWGERTGDQPYYVTEESRPAPLGASLGWLLQLDGDNMRNAFLNAAWAKVVVPIRPGREREAIAWLRDYAEGETGLKDPYRPQPGDPQVYQGKTVGGVLDLLITDLSAQHQQTRTVDQTINALPGERVFEHGFDPLAGGVRVDTSKPLEVFDQWIEVLPTDQVVAVEYKTP